MQILFLFYRLCLKALIHSGAWLSFLLLWLLDEVLIRQTLGITMSPKIYPTLYPIYEVSAYILFAIPIILISGRKIYRLFKPQSTMQRAE